MEKAEKKRNIVRGVQFKFVGLMAALIVILFGLLNTYPLITSRDLVFSEKQSAMTSQAAVMSSSLSTLESLSKESISEVMNLLDLNAYDRIVVTDAAGTAVYDTASENNLVGKAADLDAVTTALEGKTVFNSRFADGAFSSCAAMPIKTGKGAHSFRALGDGRSVGIAVAILAAFHPALFFQPVKKVQNGSRGPALCAQLFVDIPPGDGRTAGPHRQHHLLLCRRVQVQFYCNTF